MNALSFPHNVSIKAGGSGSLITTFPRAFASTALFPSSNTYTLYPGTGLVTLPGRVGKTVLKSFKFNRFAEIGHPVSVCHHVSLIKTFGKWR